MLLKQHFFYKVKCGLVIKEIIIRVAINNYYYNADHFLYMFSKNCQIVHYNFPEPELTSSDFWFYQTNNANACDIQFTIIYDKIKQQILIFENLIYFFKHYITFLNIIYSESFTECNLSFAGDHNHTVTHSPLIMGIFWQLHIHTW